MNKILYQIKELETEVARNLNICNKLNQKILPKSLTQIQIINYIIEKKEKDIYQKDLEEKLNLRRATISGVLKTMEKNKLIERTSNELDARSKKIYLNKELKKQILNDSKKIDYLENKLVKGITNEELEIFSNILNKMKYNINSD